MLLVSECTALKSHLGRRVSEHEFDCRKHNKSKRREQKENMTNRDIGQTFVVVLSLLLSGCVPCHLTLVNVIS